jgi:serine/threonine protein kinase
MKVQDKTTLDKIKIETAVMTMCCNKNIIKYTCSYYFKNCLFMFIEFMDGGMLTDIVYKYVGKMTDNVIAYILR